jgi:hypothetical protein
LLKGKDFPISIASTFDIQKKDTKRCKNMKIQFFIFIFFTFAIIGNCQKEEEYWKTSPEFKLFVLREILWQQPNCPSPNLILEKGVAYSVTLKAGERFWFDLKERKENSAFSDKKYTIKVIKESQDEIGSRSFLCLRPAKFDGEPSKGNGVSSTESQFRFIAAGSNTPPNPIFQLETLGTDAVITITHILTED